MFDTNGGYLTGAQGFSGLLNDPRYQSGDPASVGPSLADIQAQQNASGFMNGGSISPDTGTTAPTNGLSNVTDSLGGFAKNSLSNIGLASAVKGLFTGSFAPSMPSIPGIATGIARGLIGFAQDQQGETNPNSATENGALGAASFGLGMINPALGVLSAIGLPGIYREMFGTPTTYGIGKQTFGSDFGVGLNAAQVSNQARAWSEAVRNYEADQNAAEGRGISNGVNQGWGSKFGVGLTDSQQNDKTQAFSGLLGQFGINADTTAQTNAKTYADTDMGRMARYLDYQSAARGIENDSNQGWGNSYGQGISDSDAARQSQALHDLAAQFGYDSETGSYGGGYGNVGGAIGAALGAAHASASEGSSDGGN